LAAIQCRDARPWRLGRHPGPLRGRLLTAGRQRLSSRSAAAGGALAGVAAGVPARPCHSVRAARDESRSETRNRRPDTLTLVNAVGIHRITSLKHSACRRTLARRFVPLNYLFSRWKRQLRHRCAIRYGTCFGADMSIQWDVRWITINIGMGLAPRLPPPRINEDRTGLAHD